MTRTLLLLLVTLLCAGCSTEVVYENEGQKELTIQVVNYMQYELDELTRAENVSALDNLALAVFEAETGREVIAMKQQKKGDKDYGSFNMSLPYGTYQVVVLGYQNSRLCTSLTATEATFAEGYVPQTFLSNTLLTVNVSTEAQQSILLKRAVAAFTITATDATPMDIDRMVFTGTGGGNKLNPRTGLASAIEERENTITVASGSKGKVGKVFTTYTFLPQQSATMTWHVEALTSTGKLLREHTFANVPMKINSRSLYEGNFFTDDTFSTQIQVETEWQDTINVSY